MKTFYGRFELTSNDLIYNMAHVLFSCMAIAGEWIVICSQLARNWTKKKEINKVGLREYSGTCAYMKELILSIELILKWEEKEIRDDRVLESPNQFGLCHPSTVQSSPVQRHISNL
ncbi:hypothetical protein SAY86_029275 [Trapa natans]|uniref:Uncharacterized protein n=1 Tax=Trapa natans TaxID=22666 RepID=A0AAN7M3F4_TRANT|nr:hypothetical protein SAY86_029275 [Trapa natans]